MKQISKITLLLSILSLILASLNRFTASPVKADVVNPIWKSTKISVSIGAPALTLFGYAPARTRVMLFGIGVSEEIYSQDNGYFEFDNVYLPSSEAYYPELCLLASYLTTSTQPTCLPALPVKNLSYDIGPVILSPIITIDKASFPIGTQVDLKGLTTPNTEVNIYMAEEKQSSFTLVANALAYYIPVYQTTSDTNGEFQFNLPSSFPSQWKIFGSSTFLDAPSAKSNTLSFKVEPPIYRLVNFIKSIIDILRPYFIYFVIAVEIIILAFLIIFSANANRKFLKKGYARYV